ncbi:unnamed protein product [Caenorhabditis nigoni]
MTSSEYTELSRSDNFQDSESLRLLRSLQQNFPINELSNEQWHLMEIVIDKTKSVPINQIVTYRLCERVEFCSENGVFVLVSRYIEINPFDRRLRPKKTVQVLPAMYPIEMYLKNNDSVLKF